MMFSGSMNSGGWNESPTLAEMYLDEARSIMLTKSNYDMEFPEHKKEISRDKMLWLARTSVVNRLCDPDDSDESIFECDNNPYFDDLSS